MTRYAVANSETGETVAWCPRLLFARMIANLLAEGHNYQVGFEVREEN